MHGYATHTFILVNDKGEERFAKFHYKSDQGIKNLTDEDIRALSSTNPKYASNDLFTRIQSGRFPSWTVSFQIMEMEQASTFRFSVFDPTKIWPHSEFPLQQIGKLVLNRNPDNYFAEVEQSAFNPANLVPGIRPSFDKVLQARLFSCSDAARYRLGTNYMQIPINCPYTTRVLNQQRDGQMSVNGNGGNAPNYHVIKEGNSGTAKMSNSVGNEHEPLAYYSDSQLSMVNATPQTSFSMNQKSFAIGRYVSYNADDDYIQPGIFWRNILKEDERNRLVKRMAESLIKVKLNISAQIIRNVKLADETWGRMLEESLMLAKV